MKCPACWTDKAYVHPIPGWKGLFMAATFRVPMKCHHCYHKFSTWWFFTLGQQIEPPQKQVSPNARPAGPSYAAQCLAATNAKMPRPTCSVMDTRTHN